eukprot:COSAG03_NODE_1797_length_3507_cov_380.294014_4_plen_121_part_00
MRVTTKTNQAQCIHSTSLQAHVCPLITLWAYVCPSIRPVYAWCDKGHKALCPLSVGQIDRHPQPAKELLSSDWMPTNLRHSYLDEKLLILDPSGDSRLGLEKSPILGGGTGVMPLAGHTV